MESKLLALFFFLCGLSFLLMKATTPAMQTDPPRITTTTTAISSPSDNPPSPVSADLDLSVALEEALGGPVIVLGEAVGVAVEDLFVICVPAECEAVGGGAVVTFAG